MSARSILNNFQFFYRKNQISYTQSVIRKNMMNFNESEQWNTSEKDPNLFCAGATDEDLEWFGHFSYWIEGVFQLGLGKSSS